MIRQSRRGFRACRPGQHNKCPPKPAQCEWCHEPIGERDPVWYDRRYASFHEHTDAMGNTIIVKHAGVGYCSMACMMQRRESLFRAAKERSIGKPLI